MSENQTLPELPETTEKSLVERAHSLFTDGILRAREKIPQEYLDMTDEMIERRFEITPTDRILRLSFWREVERALAAGEDVMKPVNAYTGVTSNKQFYNVLNNPHRGAYVLRPPRSYEQQAHEIINKGVSKLREALDANLVYTNGHLDARAAKTILDIVSYFENRVKGTLTQKIKLDSTVQTQNISLNVGNIVDVESKLKEVKAKISQYENSSLIETLPPKVRDVGETDAE